MGTPFLGEIKMFAGNFAPRGYALCNGQLLPISQNTALFSIMGTTYGGNGLTNYGLPDLQERMPLHAGQGPGLGAYTQGQQGGEAAQTLNVAEMPSHAHTLHATSTATTGTPSGSTVLAATAGAKIYGAAGNAVTMSSPLGANAGGQAHENRQPYLGLNFIVALQGIFPARN